MEAKLRPFFKASVKNRQLPGIGAFLVDKKGIFLFREAFGSTQIENPTAPTFDVDTVLPMFSCTTLWTTIAALQLIEQGKLTLSDYVEQYVSAISKVQVLECNQQKEGSAPSFRPPNSKPTILQLMGRPIQQGFPTTFSTN
ncbi:beta-lactamase [Exophiala aquamarina CBS 119918]|uniref:Beta-lactamase n=1 Tax=Exophiala aquamarina CBS 119918 TaxID=1182545 RepID=A0A072PK52_9EURO|nr:beta-lactamase [Exophiala aquamarina CBS 119918]KEF60137.1 beta-lactamase [Exophiala aquamarina CBS 119918]